MPINYVITKRIFGFDKTKSEKFVVKSVKAGDVSFQKLCTRVCQICGAHRGIVQLVIAGLVDAMINDLEDGKTVKLGEFGLFRPAIRAKAVDSEEEASASNIYRRRILFTPGKALKSAMNDTPITRRPEPDTDYTDNSSSGGSGGFDPSA